jgi:hypothetical protein
MNMKNSYAEIDIGEEFERLWEAAQRGPNASALPGQGVKRLLTMPLALRPLCAEEFRGWLLP